MSQNLDTRPARSLTSREISKIIGSLLGGLAGWCEVDEIMNAMNHFHEYSTRYRFEWEQVARLNEMADAIKASTIIDEKDDR